jgi:ABC-type transport system involved in multi-copper enzyme maturation permease subunit
MPVILRWFLALGITNPITVRLVQNGSRRARHLYIRAAYLAILIAVLLWVLIINNAGGRGDALSYQQLSLAGSNAFKYIAYLQIGLICILAPVFMAGAIAQEADPKTWDILLTTPMSATQIVLGNLIGRLFFILALLFSSLPLFAVTQYFGGVAGTSIFASYLIAACAALLVGAMAIALSVSRLVGRRAVFTFYIAVVSYIGITWAIDSITFGGAAVSWMTALNPFLALNALLDAANYPSAGDGTQTGLAAWFLEHPVRTWCTLSAGLSALIVLTSVITVRIGGFVAITGTTGGGAAPWYRKLLGLGAAGATERPNRAVWNNPIAWREAAARNATLGRIFARWSFIAMGGLFGVLIVLAFHTGHFTTPGFRAALLYTAIGEMAVITLIAVNMSATAVSREREDGTLDLILTTPITPAQYLTGKLKGIIAYLLPLLAVPVATLGIAGLYVAVGGLGNPGVSVPVTLPGVTVNIPAVLPEAGFIMLFSAVPFAAFCVVIGMQWSLKSKGTISSVVGTMGIVAVVAGVVGLCSWNAGADLPILGPVLGGFSPASVVWSLVHAEHGMEKTVAQSLPSARVALAIGVVLAAAVLALVVYLLHASMTRTFDMTVRKLAGTK